MKLNTYILLDARENNDPTVTLTQTLIIVKLDFSMKR